jgi:hypothetical protein
LHSGGLPTHAICAPPLRFSGAASPACASRPPPASIRTSPGQLPRGTFRFPAALIEPVKFPRPPIPSSFTSFKIHLALLKKGSIAANPAGLRRSAMHRRMGRRFRGWLPAPRHSARPPRAGAASFPSYVRQSLSHALRAARRSRRSAPPSDFASLCKPARRKPASSPVRAPWTEGLPPASFRFRLAADALAFGSRLLPPSPQRSFTA